MYAGQLDREIPIDWDDRMAQHDAVDECGEPNLSLLERAKQIDTPVFEATVTTNRCSCLFLVP